MTIDITPESIGYLNKQQIAALNGCSPSTISRVIRVLRSAVPDEFASHPGATHYSLEQQAMIARIVQLLNGGNGLTYAQIENEYLEKGWPEE